MSISPLAGKPAPKHLLTNVPRLVAGYYTIHPDLDDPNNQVSFGTSGHRGTSLDGSFNEDHIVAICQAIADYRAGQGIDGPLFLGMDTHALSEPAHATAVEVFAANGVKLRLQAGPGYTPTPSISRAILAYNRRNTGSQADGVVITPSHNPPSDGGFKYNPPNGGPADTGTTKLIQQNANRLMQDGLKAARRMPYARALRLETTEEFDFIMPYVQDLKNVVDMEAITRSRIRIGVDPMGGAAINYWEPIASTYGLNLEVVNPNIDPTFAFMHVDWDGKIRMDSSSPYAMAGLIELKDLYNIAFGNDPDVDRHGIVTPSRGLMNPNHYLATAIWYLFTHRPGWRADAAVGKTLVSSGMIDKVARKINRRLVEVPVGFKWFVDGLIDGSFGFGGEESAGASFLRQDGTVWTTDKDGIILDLLAAEITAVMGQDPGVCYQALEDEFGQTYYARVEAPADREQKQVLTDLSAELIQAKELAGSKITGVYTRAPGNNAPIGGLKVVTEDGWFAARPSGTEDIYKIYAESFRSLEHLHRLQDEARLLVADVFKAAGV